MTIQNQIETCRRCIDQITLEDIEYDEEDKQHHTLMAFIGDDAEGFRSDLCLTCDDGSVPDYLPESQVIRFIKKIFKTYNIKIDGLTEYDFRNLEAYQRKSDEMSSM